LNHPYADYRPLFPVLASKIHLASCSQGAISKTVSESIEEYLNSLHTMGVNWNQSIQEVEKAKQGFAKLIGAEPNFYNTQDEVRQAIDELITVFQKGNGYEKNVR
jgi:selenocysteine lyase/cysteine desulfurase